MAEQLQPSTCTRHSDANNRVHVVERVLSLSFVQSCGTAGQGLPKTTSSPCFC